EVVGRTTDYDAPAEELHAGEPPPERTVTAYFDAVAHPTQIFDRARLRPGDRLQGPAIVHETLATTVVDPGWRAEVGSRGELLLTDLGISGHREVSADVSQGADP